MPFIEINCKSIAQENWKGTSFIDLVVVALKEQGFPKMRITNIKESGTLAFIDDRAIRFDNWQNIRKYFG